MTNTLLMGALAASLALPLALPLAAGAQDLGDKPASIVLPGVSFTRSLNNAAENTRVEGGKLTVRSDAKRDAFRDPDGKVAVANAPVLLAAVDNGKPFTLTARVTPTLLETYDAGALYVWARDDLWLKMALEQDERKNARMVTVRTVGTSDDNNHDVVTAKTVHMKISSDTVSVGFYYSLDGETWQLIRVFKNDYPAKLWLGISAQSPVGAGTSAAFEGLSLTQTSVKDFRLGK
jgi:uncharacterized protein